MDLLVEEAVQAEQPQPQPQPQPQGEGEGVFKGLYESMKPVVWVVKVTQMVNKTPINKCLTAFAVDERGLLLTTAHGWYNWKHKTIQVRRVDGTSDFENATIVSHEVTCDLCLLKVHTAEGDGKVVVGRFGGGTLEVGQIIMAIGRPNDAVASGLIGRIVYPCVQLTDFEFGNDDDTCCEFNHMEVLTLPYHIMGHICNRSYFDFDISTLGFIRHFQARLPIIHSAGLVGSVGDRVSGAPLFTTKGEIVGMFLFGLGGFDIGIHVSVINKFLAEHKGDA